VAVQSITTPNKKQEKKCPNQAYFISLKVFLPLASEYKATKIGK